MRRKSERTATKKAKSSPEKKLEKVKRTRTRRRKQSSSSENESVEETAVSVPEPASIVEVEKKAPQTPVKTGSPEESQDQVWQVKATESPSESGEIQKLKICLTRPPSTPERAERSDRSPRSKKKHTRATSSSDTPSGEPPEEKRKSRRSKRCRESKDESERNNDSQGDECETDVIEDTHKVIETSENEITQSSEAPQITQPDEAPMSTTNDEPKAEETISVIIIANEDEPQDGDDKVKIEEDGKTSDADTTVQSPKGKDNADVSVIESSSATQETNTGCSIQETQNKSDDSVENKTEVTDSNMEYVSSNNSVSSKVETKDKDNSPAKNEGTDKIEHSVNEIKSPQKCDRDSSQIVPILPSSDNDIQQKVVEKRKMSAESVESKDGDEPKESYRNKGLERSESIKSTSEETMVNGQAAPIVINRKRRWGSRTSKPASQTSITISTDVLKEIIPDVKPVEFEEVIEEKKHHRRVETVERVERPVLPKIVIDNSENVEQHKRERDEKDKENVKDKDSHSFPYSDLGHSRKISIVKDSDSIIARPPSPPRHKQSCILYITNLVRPFTLPQLKNLLQRTGRISEDGFWIDRIKSKCFVKYENEDQAVETRHALHGVTWPVSNPKTLHVDFSTQEAFDKAKASEEADVAPPSAIPGTVEDWLREQDMKRERGDQEKPWERKAVVREWDVGKNEKDKDKARPFERPPDKRRHRTPERSPEPARKFKKKEEEAPAKLLDDLFRKTKTTPCIYWLPLSAETIAVKEEQRRKHMAEHERRLAELRRTHRRH